MGTRIASGIIGAPIVLVAILLGNLWLTAFLIIVANLAYFELRYLINRFTDKPSAVLGVPWIVFLIVGASIGGNSVPYILAAGLLFSLILTVSKRKNPVRSMLHWTTEIAGPLCIGLPCTLAILTRSLDFGANWLFLTIITVFSTDIGAFLIGKTWGRHKLAPLISPKKTWEGAIGGFICAIAICFILTGQVPNISFSPINAWQSLWIGGSISIVAQIGDLLESKLKRTAQVKESGWLIPGHGGVLDRVDSVFLPLVLVYYIATGLS